MLTFLICFPQSLPEHEYLLNAVFTAMKLASVAKKQSDALSVACSLLGDIYDHAAQTNQVNNVIIIFVIMKMPALIEFLRF